MYANRKVIPQVAKEPGADQEHEDVVVAKATIDGDSAVSTPRGREIVRESLVSAYPELAGVPIRRLEMELDGDDLTVRCAVRGDDIAPGLRPHLARNRDPLFEEAIREQLRLEWTRTYRSRQR